MKKNIKILSIIGLILIAIVFIYTENFKPYILETIGFLILVAYGWNYFKDRTIMLWISGFFIIVYALFNYSLIDFILWILAFIFVYKDKKD